MKIIKNIHHTILPPLTSIINQSLKSGIFPKLMKLAKVIPLFKKEDNTIVDNYRPISLLPCFSKLLERIVFNQLYDYFNANKLIYKSQHGFREQHSTETAALEFMDRVISSLDKGNIELAVFIDLSKAFDTINHSILLYKLSYYGVKNTSLQWFHSYLTERTQFVEYDGTKSDQLPLDTGVPQGSILGPLLFIIYMNDVYKASTTFEFILYADDTSLESPLCKFRLDSNPDAHNISEQINSELSKLAEWLCINKLSINAKKTKYMLFHFPQINQSTLPRLDLKIEGTPIERVPDFNFLGITINEHLKWNAHINKIQTKLNRSIGTLRRLQYNLPVTTLKTLYNSLILPHLQYGILLWGNSNHNLDLLQKRAIRVVCKAKFRAHTDPLFKEHNILKIKDMYVLSCLKFAHKHISNKLPIYFNSWLSTTRLHTHNTRSTKLWTHTTPRHLSLKGNLKFSLPRLLNSKQALITNKLYSHSLHGFSTYVKNIMLDEYTTTCTIDNCFVCSQHR